MFAATLVGWAKAATADELEARLASKRAFLEARLAAAHEATRLAALAPVAPSSDFETAVVDENGTDWGRFAFPLPDGAGPSHPADAAWAFAQDKGLPRALRRRLQDDACDALPLACGARRRAVVASVPVDLGRGPGFEVACELWDGAAAADAAFAFAQAQQLPAGAAAQLKAALCGRLAFADLDDQGDACRRDRALLFYRPAGPWPVGPGAAAAAPGSSAADRAVGAGLVVELPAALEVWAGEEPADALRALLFVAHSRPRAEHQLLADHVCALPALAKRAHVQRARATNGTAFALGGDGGSTDASGWEAEAEAVAAAWPYLKCSRRRVVEQRQDVSGFGTVRPAFDACGHAQSLLLACESLPWPINTRSLFHRGSRAACWPGAFCVPLSSSRCWKAKKWRTPCTASPTSTGLGSTPPPSSSSCATCAGAGPTNSCRLAAATWRSCSTPPCAPAWATAATARRTRPGFRSTKAPQLRARWWCGKMKSLPMSSTGAWTCDQPVAFFKK